MNLVFCALGWVCFGLSFTVDDGTLLLVTAQVFFFVSLCLSMFSIGRTWEKYRR
jgi:hypothetical protein